MSRPSSSSRPRAGSRAEGSTLAIGSPFASAAASILLSGSASYSSNNNSILRSGSRNCNSNNNSNSNNTLFSSSTNAATPPLLPRPSSGSNGNSYSNNNTNNNNSSSSSSNSNNNSGSRSRSRSSSKTSLAASGHLVLSEQSHITSAPGRPSLAASRAVLGGVGLGDSGVGSAVGSSDSSGGGGGLGGAGVGSGVGSRVHLDDSGVGNALGSRASCGGGSAGVGSGGGRGSSSSNNRNNISNNSIASSNSNSNSNSRPASGINSNSSTDATNNINNKTANSNTTNNINNINNNTTNNNSSISNNSISSNIQSEEAPQKASGRVSLGRSPLSAPTGVPQKTLSSRKPGKPDYLSNLLPELQLRVVRFLGWHDICALWRALFGQDGPDAHVWRDLVQHLVQHRGHGQSFLADLSMLRDAKAYKPVVRAYRSLFPSVVDEAFALRYSPSRVLSAIVTSDDLSLLKAVLESQRSLSLDAQVIILGIERRAKRCIHHLLGEARRSTKGAGSTSSSRASVSVVYPTKLTPSGSSPWAALGAGSGADAELGEDFVDFDSFPQRFLWSAAVAGEGSICESVWLFLEDCCPTASFKLSKSTKTEVQTTRHEEEEENEREEEGGQGRWQQQHPASSTAATAATKTTTAAAAAATTAKTTARTTTATATNPGDEGGAQRKHLWAVCCAVGCGYAPLLHKCPPNLIHHGLARISFRAPLLPISGPEISFEDMPLGVVTAFQGHPGLFGPLRRAGVDLELCSKRGISPIDAAKRHKSAAMRQTLLKELGASETGPPTTSDEDPLPAAIEKGDLKLVRSLLQRGAKLNADDLSAAVRSGDLDVLAFVQETCSATVGKAEYRKMMSQTAARIRQQQRQRAAREANNDDNAS